jgi:UV DNA damage repair endonuclease
VLIHLNEILKYNVKNNLLFFRISSDLVLFASHSICKFEWDKVFQSELQQIGEQKIIVEYRTCLKFMKKIKMD